MEKLIDVNFYPVQKTLSILLKDKTTGKNIIWATDTYELNGKHKDSDEILLGDLVGFQPIDMQPRINKALEDQQARTRKKAEVFTPVWLCNQMNNHLDEDWFGRKNVFNEEKEQGWETVQEKIKFTGKKTWKKYVDSKRLEITCGEAPFLVSRYDAASGALIEPPKNRIGLLDRKLRVVNENTETKEDWLKWVNRAFESCYGFEYQGDSLLIARINFILTFYDYYVERWEIEPSIKELRHLAHTISWNLWQMDGFTDCIPLGKPQEQFHQETLFELFQDDDLKQPSVAPLCRIKNWRASRTMTYQSLKNKS